MVFLFQSKTIKNTSATQKVKPVKTQVSLAVNTRKILTGFN
jgi:hypothetical protein